MYFYEQKCNLQYQKVKIQNRICGNVCPLILRLICPTTSRVSIITLRIYENFVVLLALQKICDQSPDNNLSAKTKRQKGVVQHLNYFWLRWVTPWISYAHIFCDSPRFREVPPEVYMKLYVSFYDTRECNIASLCLTQVTQVHVYGWYCLVKVVHATQWWELLV